MKSKCILFSSGTSDWGLLIVRAGLGIMFFLHGLPKITGGPETWAYLGQSMSNIGINFGFTFWGFLAAVSEGIGGLFLIFGLLTRVAATGMFFTMFMATIMHLSNGDGLMGASHAIEAGVVFAALIIAGAGKYSVDFWLGNLCNRK